VSELYLILKNCQSSRNLTPLLALNFQAEEKTEGRLAPMDLVPQVETPCGLKKNIVKAIF